MYLSTCNTAEVLRRSRFRRAGGEGSEAPAQEAAETANEFAVLQHTRTRCTQCAMLSLGMYIAEAGRQPMSALTC